MCTLTLSFIACIYIYTKWAIDNSDEKAFIKLIYSFGVLSHSTGCDVLWEEEEEEESANECTKHWGSKQVSKQKRILQMTNYTN